MRTIGIIGRPNVGKSSLFNVLLKKQRSIVMDFPGTTMDELAEVVYWRTKSLQLLDSQGVYEEGDETVLKSVTTRSDACLFVIDGKVGVTPFDRWIAKFLHQWGGPVRLLVNKSDQYDESYERDVRKLGFGEPLFVSATQRSNLTELKDWCVEAAGDKKEVVPGYRPISVALIGKPNAGKSTLMNRLCQTHVSKVSDQPLTTRDPVGYELLCPKGSIRFIDTAGMRRPSRNKTEVETFSIQGSTRSIRQADVILLCIAAHEKVTDQDMRLLNLLEREGKPALILLNFWDRLDSEEKRTFLEYGEFTRVIKHLHFLRISGLTGFGVDLIVPKIFQLYEQATQRISTSRLNKVIKTMTEKNPPPALGRNTFNILYASQVSAQPPTFVFFMNRLGALPKSYQKYVENYLKTSLNLKGQSIRVHFRAKEDRHVTPK